MMTLYALKLGYRHIGKFTIPYDAVFAVNLEQIRLEYIETKL